MSKLFFNPVCYRLLLLLSVVVCCLWWYLLSCSWLISTGLNVNNCDVTFTLCFMLSTRKLYTVCVCAWVSKCSCSVEQFWLHGTRVTGVLYVGFENALMLHYYQFDVTLLPVRHLWPTPIPAMWLMSLMSLMSIPIR